MERKGLMPAYFPTTGLFQFAAGVIIALWLRVNSSLDRNMEKVMDDYQKWLEAAADIAEDIEYLRDSLQKKDIESLQIALAVYRGNAESGVPWPNPDDLYCILTRPNGAEVRVSTQMRPDFKMAS
jgi:predicted RNA-binding protein with EMAP domain